MSKVESIERNSKRGGGLVYVLCFDNQLFFNRFMVSSLDEKMMNTDDATVARSIYF